MTTARATALGTIAALVVGIGALIAVEVSRGALDLGERTYADACLQAGGDPFPDEGGLDATLQRILLGTLDGAACELGVSREELVLSLEPTSGFGDEVRWDRDTLERALRAGALRAIDDANDRNTIPGWVASILEVVVERAPIDWILGRVDLPFIEE